MITSQCKRSSTPKWNLPFLNKMKVLESCQVLWRVGGVCLSASATTKDVYISVLANVLICGNMVSFFAMVFAYAMVIDDVKRFFYAILQFLVLFNIIATYLSVIFVKRDIGQMVDSLQQLIDDSESLSPLHLEWSKMNWNIVCRIEISSPAHHVRCCRTPSPLPHQKGNAVEHNNLLRSIHRLFLSVDCTAFP